MKTRHYEAEAARLGLRFVPLAARGKKGTIYRALTREIAERRRFLQGFGDDEGDVVVLFAGAEAVDFVHDGGEQVAGGEGAVAAEGSGEALFAKFVAIVVEGFGDAVGVERENVAGRNLGFADLAVPVLKGADDGGGGFEMRERIVAAKQQCGEMAAVGVAQAARGVVVLGEKQRGERAVRGVVAKKLVHGTQQALRL